MKDGRAGFGGLTPISVARALGSPAPTWDVQLRESLRGLNAARDWDVFLAETLPKTRKLLGAQ